MSEGMTVPDGVPRLPVRTLRVDVLEGPDPGYRAIPRPIPPAAMPMASSGAEPVRLATRPSAARDTPAPPTSRHAAPAPSASVVAVVPTETGTGVLVIAGKGSVGADIYVDGNKQERMAPLTIDLPAGMHSVKLVWPGGRDVGSRQVHITAHHTGSAPFK